MSLLHETAGNSVDGVEALRNVIDLGKILDSVADGVFTVDSRMRIQFFNRAAEEITGFLNEEAIGQHYHTVLRSSGDTFSCPIKKNLKTGGAVLNMGMKIVSRNNHVKNISLSTSALCDSSGKACGGVGMIRDLSQFNSSGNVTHDKFSFKNIVSRNAIMKKLICMTEDVAASDATVLIRGESGAGKELFARAIHESSSRKNGPLFVVSCVALPEHLCEAEMFGVRKGAFAGATENRQGRLELCSGGTFFIDEIGDLPLSLQGKLLKVLESREFQPLGAKNPMKADVRFIAATHRNLEKMVESGTFLRDLYLRINGVQLNIPPLRERKEDVPLLMEVMLKKFNLAYDKNINGFSLEALNILLTYDFPGNVRELQNVIEQSVILCKGGEILVEHLPTRLINIYSSAKALRQLYGKAPEVEALCDLIGRHKGSRSDAPYEPGVDSSTLWHWVKSAGLSEV
ncbi:MAG: sigma 54-interacting transcriptional regulator [Desulfuromonadaceae bacterium]|nr:sigma 54-interacting transcriptional regulator [Desulfuromonadaceae bacterium]MDD2847420.1 sigma 54-interacting transcriptional regulator [Desulfuromonadaceae bacterium]MDD4131467.1 sigma 54-interacting transcriptional regulator [Desulfuromonadaceae bacterium]